MRIIPVIDLLDGVCVHAIAGKRAQYLPLRSPLSVNATPVEVARSYRNLGLRECYVADLNAIQGSGDNLDATKEIADAGLSVWLDAGIVDECLFREFSKLDWLCRIIVGSETLSGPDCLRQISSDPKCVFSLDQNGAQILAAFEPWKSKTALDVAVEAIQQCQVKRMILLNLANVGVRNGTTNGLLSKQITKRFPDIELTVGGGVRNIEDLMELKSMGADAALVATALHRLDISKQDIDSLE